MQDEELIHLRSEVYSDPERGEVTPVHLEEVESAIEEVSAIGREVLGQLWQWEQVKEVGDRKVVFEVWNLRSSRARYSETGILAGNVISDAKVSGPDEMDNLANRFFSQ